MRSRILVLALAAVLAVSAAARAEEWRLVYAGTTQIGELSVGGPGAQRLPSGWLEFWERIVYNERGRSFALGRLREQGMSEAELRKHASMVEAWYLWHWDPATQRVQCRATVRYGPGNRVLSARSWPEKETRWRPVKPGSYAEDMVHTAEQLVPTPSPSP